jgi:hypothetical protein
MDSKGPRDCERSMKIPRDSIHPSLVACVKECACGRGPKEDDHFCSECYLDMEAREGSEQGHP